MRFFTMFKKTFLSLDIKTDIYSPTFPPTSYFQSKNHLILPSFCTSRTKIGEYFCEIFFQEILSNY